MSDNTKRIARQLFYTGNTDIEPTEEEEYKLNTKYGITIPKKDRFKKEVAKVMKYNEDEEGGSAIPEDRLPPTVKSAISRIYDELEDEFNLDIDNKDPKKYQRLQQRFDVFKKAAWRKVMFLEIPEIYKRDLSKRIDSATTPEEILLLLCYRAGS